MYRYLPTTREFKLIFRNSNNIVNKISDDHISYRMVYKCSIQHQLAININHLKSNIRTVWWQFIWNVLMLFDFYFRIFINNIRWNLLKIIGKIMHLFIGKFILQCYNRWLKIVKILKNSELGFSKHVNLTVYFIFRPTYWKWKIFFVRQVFCTVCPV